MRSHVVAILILPLLVGCSAKNVNSDAGHLQADTLQTQASNQQADEARSFSYEARQGKHLYVKYCAVCHGTEGKGDGFNAFNLDPKPRDFTDVRYMDAVSDARLMETIIQGGRGVNRSVLMPSWGGRLTTSEQTYVTAYVRSLGKLMETHYLAVFNPLQRHRQKPRPKPGFLFT